ncbi:MAG: flavin reductase family protein [Geminicoccaceae bacterium]|nr:flavin reductase family protein [Geminicoccaceae bacterium]MDW8126063.1 flavin reductase family protein [Geminicoccaceae bacterium]
MPVTPERFIAGMRLHAAGVTVVASEFEGRRAGLTATAVCSVSAEPPQLLVCVHRAAEANPIIRASRCFSVNLLAAHQRRLADRFAGRLGHGGAERFAEGRWVRLVTGAPVLEGARAVFDCILVESLEAGTHTIFLGSVEAVLTDPALEPLVYHEGEYGLVAQLPL